MQESVPADANRSSRESERIVGVNLQASFRITGTPSLPRNSFPFVRCLWTLAGRAIQSIRRTSEIFIDYRGRGGH